MTKAEAAPAADTFDALIIGAGSSGMYMLHRLLGLGMSVRAIEAGSDVGGTWYWNRYPGCRFDSESYSYGYSFNDDMLRDWTWSEEFAAQPETLSYYSKVADRLRLREHIQFDKRVAAACYDEEARGWEVTLDDGTILRATFLISAAGPLSAFQLPAFKGIDSFKGDWWHTARWPQDPEGFGGLHQDFTGKRIAVVGTGASGVQVIQESAKTAQRLYVFQRKPNWCAPLNNSAISSEKMEQIRASYDRIFQTCRETFGGFLCDFNAKSALEVSDEEREAFFEELYAAPGFGIWLGNYSDVLVDQKANDLISDFVARKIRERVNDPKVAEKLIPDDHGFGTRRVPMETRYYEAYNQDNVELIDLRETPVERITESGIRTTARDYEVDMIIYATGFDAVTGALDRIDIRGRHGEKLKDKWQNGPRTFLGLQTVGFPNFFTLVGPHNGAGFCNIPRCAEQNVEWVTALIGHLRDHDYAYVEPRPEAELEWTAHVNETVRATLFPQADSWFMGVNDNVAGKQRNFLLYAGGNPTYRQKCADAQDSGYVDFVLK